jgi:hypothetical protein
MARKKRKSAAQQQWIKVHTRSRFGPSMKPAPVVVKKADSDEIVEIADPWAFQRKRPAKPS